jgi:hypothetical protein
MRLLLSALLVLLVTCVAGFIAGFLFSVVTH